MQLTTSPVSLMTTTTIGAELEPAKKRPFSGEKWISSSPTSVKRCRCCNLPYLSFSGEQSSPPRWIVSSDSFQHLMKRLTRWPFQQEQQRLWK